MGSGWNLYENKGLFISTGTPVVSVIVIVGDRNTSGTGPSLVP